MQTSLARRQRQRRLSDRRRPRGSGSIAVKAAAVAIPLFLFAILVLLGVAGATAAVAAYSYLSRDLADPQPALDDLTFTSRRPSFDRSGQVQLAQLGDDRREVVTFDRHPAGPDRRHDVDRGQDVLGERRASTPPGFIAAAIDTISGNDRGGSTITQQLVRARLLPASAFDGSIYERKAKEIIQSIRLTQAYPGERRQADDHARSTSTRTSTATAATAWRPRPAATGTRTSRTSRSRRWRSSPGIPQSPTRFDLVKNAVEETYKDAKGQDADAARRAADHARSSSAATSSSI